MSKNHSRDLENIVNIFFQDGFNLAIKYLAGEITEAKIIRLMTAAYEAVDGLLVSFWNRCVREGLDIDCRQGCDWCCHQAVLVSIQEVLLIGRYLSENLRENLLNEIHRKAMEKEAITGDKSVPEFLQIIHPCPFLDQQSCLIYPVRPMACRSYLSSSLSSCRAQYAQPGNPEVMAALYDFPLRAGRAINEGIRAVLMQKKIRTSEWIMEVFIARILADPAIFDDWISGQDPFDIRELTADENKFLQNYRDRQGSSEQGHR